MSHSLPALVLRPRPVAIAAVLLIGLSWLAPAPSVAASDPAAVKKAERLLDALGGRQAFEATRFLRFNFFGFRTHHWDRHTGRYRLEGKNREGESYVVLFDTDTKDGRAWKDAQELTGEDQAGMLQMAYGAFINDTYWLLMPYKLLDPGVTLADAPQETIDGETYDVVKLTFDTVGLTPGDTYWAYLDPETGMFARWAYHLQDWEEERPKTHWIWKDWSRHGDILLSSTRHNPEADRTATLGDIKVFDALPDSAFDSPEPLP